MRARVLLIISVTIAILGGVGVYFVVSSAEADTRTNVPKSMVGEWYQTSKTSDVIMKASISSNNTIQVNMKTRDFSSIYWMGSFDSERDPANNFTVVSKGDSDAMALSIFGSKDAEKSFTYKDGELSYKFTMMGTTTTVRLTKM